jgi:hypothetical protein
LISESSFIIVDELVKSQRLFSVMPAIAGIQFFQSVTKPLDSSAWPGPDLGYTGVTTFYGAVIVWALICDEILREIHYDLAVFGRL